MLSNAPVESIALIPSLTPLPSYIDRFSLYNYRKLLNENNPCYVAHIILSALGSTSTFTGAFFGAIAKNSNIEAALVKASASFLGKSSLAMLRPSTQHFTNLRKIPCGWLGVMTVWNVVGAICMSRTTFVTSYQVLSKFLPNRLAVVMGASILFSLFNFVKDTYVFQTKNLNYLSQLLADKNDDELITSHTEINATGKVLGALGGLFILNVVPGYTPYLFLCNYPLSIEAICEVFEAFGTTGPAIQKALSFFPFVPLAFMLAVGIYFIVANFITGLINKVSEWFPQMKEFKTKIKPKCTIENIKNLGLTAFVATLALIIGYYVGLSAFGLDIAAFPLIGLTNAFAANFLSETADVMTTIFYGESAYRLISYIAESIAKCCRTRTLSEAEIRETAVLLNTDRVIMQKRTESTGSTV